MTTDDDLAHPVEGCWPGYTHITVTEFVRREAAGTLEPGANHHIVLDSEGDQ